MKRYGILAILVAFVGVVLVGNLTAAQKAPDVIKIENKYPVDKKGPVNFSHKKHEVDYKVACTECHHEYKDGKNVWKQGDPVKKCAECHPAEGKQGDKVLNLQNAFHKNCKDCHKQKNDDAKAPFKKCTGCHPADTGK